MKMRSSCPFVWLRKRNRARSGARSYVRIHGIPFLVPQGDPPALFPIEQLIVFTLADEIIIVARKETDAGYLAGTLHFPSVPNIVHIMGIIERQHVAVEKILHATPRAHMEIAQQAFGLQRVACRIESVSSAMLPRDQSGER